jgi:hypothetical protein
MTEYQQLLKHIKRRLELAEVKPLCNCCGPGYCAGISPKFRCRSDNNIPYAQKQATTESSQHD